MTKNIMIGAAMAWPIGVGLVLWAGESWLVALVAATLGVAFSLFKGAAK